MFYMLF